jgi:2-polyprenyl-3-methyl-5-hydroxy-6-metoxy-1,4-benzoquinol methylase
VATHAPRFEQTFHVLSGLAGQDVLSIGAGACVFEEVLLRTGVAASLMAVDLPEALASYEQRYRQLGVQAAAVDLASLAPESPVLGQFDLVIAAEIVEHVRIDPRRLLRWCAAQLRPGGRVVLTTPNLRSAIRLAQHALGRPMLPDPRPFFAPPSYETEGVHVREYMPAELARFARETGFRVERHEFITAMPIHRYLFPAPLRPLLRPLLPWQLLLLRL